LRLTLELGLQFLSLLDDVRQSTRLLLIIPAEKLLEKTHTAILVSCAPYWMPKIVRVYKEIRPTDTKPMSLKAFL
jgi:hypothetical protein